MVAHIRRLVLFRSICRRIIKADRTVCQRESFTLFTEGKMIEGTWWRDGSNSEPAKYLDENGNRIKMNQGKTWICIIWNQYSEDVVIE